MNDSIKETNFQDLDQLWSNLLATNQQIKPFSGYTRLVALKSGLATVQANSAPIAAKLGRLQTRISQDLSGLTGQSVRVEFAVRENGLGEIEEVEEPDLDSFSGFDEPKENWSKLPNVIIDELPRVETISELKVILYILRHTWGFHEDERRISLDEFRNGRKKRDGSRIDNGTGLSLNAIKDGINRAVNHGFIEVDRDERDGARIKQYYRLKSKGIKV